ncbi:RT0821/Lpp0805 family surface protein [Pseudorhodoplanes sp.]|uniref:RT0821/Lpp0805 family surface protein n=1 Tax=Pseudorhodoplanes sp. TaxID=1934341 RepID=UPI003D0E3B46
MLLSVGVFAAACAACGCSTHVKLDGTAGKDDDQSSHTGSILTPPSPEGTGLPPASDLAYAKLAAAEIMNRNTRDASLPWQNPASGARGTVIPVASAYRIEGEICRDFIASYVAAGSEAWMQGEACRVDKGQWEVRRLKAWRRS